MIRWVAGARKNSNGKSTLCIEEKHIIYMNVCNLCTNKDLDNDFPKRKEDFFSVFCTNKDLDNYFPKRKQKEGSYFIPPLTLIRWKAGAGKNSNGKSTLSIEEKYSIHMNVCNLCINNDLDNDFPKRKQKEGFFFAELTIHL